MQTSEAVQDVLGWISSQERQYISIALLHPRTRNRNIHSYMNLIPHIFSQYCCSDLQRRLRLSADVKEYFFDHKDRIYVRVSFH